MEVSNIEAQLNDALIHLREGHPTEAVTILEGLLAQVAGADASPAEMLVNGLLAPAKASLGDVTSATSHAERALSLAKTLGDPEGQAHYEALLQQLADGGGAVHAMRDDPLTDEAIDATFDRAVAALNRSDGMTAVVALTPLIEASRARSLGDVEASAVGMRAQAHMMNGAVDEARVDAERALALAEAMEDPGAVAHFSGLVASLADTNAASGQALAEEARVAEAMRQAMERAGAALQDEKPEVAVETLKAALEAAKGAAVKATEASVHGMLGQALLMAERREEAEFHGKRAVALAKELGNADAAEEFEQALALIVGWVAANPADA
jgi:tetratricopeptide (TPR) repeat protein